MRRILSVWALAAMVLGAGAFCGAEDGKDLPPAPEGFIQLLKVDARGGVVMRPADFDLTRAGAKWQDWPGARMVYEPLYQGYGAYRAKLDVPAASGERPEFLSREIWSRNGFKIKQNRNYVVSVLIRTDFDRNATEFNVHLRAFDKDGRRLSPRHTLGLPAMTQGPDGWQRCEWTMTTHTDDRIAEGRASIQLYLRQGSRPVKLEIADFTFVELPAVPLKALPRGQGVSFPGGVGDLPMKVESAQIQGDHVIVKTTGASYEFNLAEDTLLASQRIEFPRALARWKSSLSFKGLRIDRQDEDVCILSNDQLTVGIQADSLLLISPQQPLRMELTNLLGGDWNRYSRASLTSMDDFGGFTVDPYVPPGTGLEGESKLLTRGLSFASLSPGNVVEMELNVGQKKEDVERNKNQETDATGPAEAGWQAQWSTRPGEFFTTSVFPPRPYPWQESFTTGWKLVFHWQKPKDYAKPAPYVSHWILWDFIPMTWGRSFSTTYETYPDGSTEEAIAAARKMGIGVLPYMSMYWTPTRDPQVFIDAVKAFKARYDIDGIYSDGLPMTDWMVAYQEMRLLRQLFPSGMLIVHDSIAQDGWVPAQFKPFIHTYASKLYLAENLPSSQGIHWQYPRYVTSQFRKANCIGTTKGDKWTDTEGKPMKERNALVTLVYNGRNNLGFANPEYYSALGKLHELWKEKGSEPYFYDRYYLPTAQKLTGYKIGRAGMPIMERKQEGGKEMLTLRSLTPGAEIYFTTDGTTPTQASERYTGPIDLGRGRIAARAFAEGLDPSAVAKAGTE